MYVSGLLKDIPYPNIALNNVFLKYGGITRIEGDFSQGSCLVTFKSIFSAFEAVRQLNFAKIQYLSGEGTLKVTFDNRVNRNFPELPSPLYFPDACVADGEKKPQLVSSLQHTLVRVHYNGSYSLHFITGTSLGEPGGPYGQQELLLHLEGIPEPVPATSISHGNPFILQGSEDTVSVIHPEILELQARLQQTPEQMLTVDQMATAIWNIQEVEKSWSPDEQARILHEQEANDIPEPTLRGELSDREIEAINSLLSTLRTEVDPLSIGGLESISSKGLAVPPPTSQPVEATEETASAVVVVYGSPLIIPPHNINAATTPGSGRSTSQRSRTGRRNRGGAGAGGGGGGGDQGPSPFTLPPFSGDSELLRKSESPPTIPVPTLEACRDTRSKFTTQNRGNRGPQQSKNQDYPPLQPSPGHCKVNTKSSASPLRSHNIFHAGEEQYPAI